MTELTLSVEGDTITLAGELDAATADTVRAALVEFANRQVNIDMADVTFMDSTGLKSMINARNAGTVVKVVAATSAVRRLFEITGLSQEFGLE